VRDGQGREVLARLELPLPMLLVGDVAAAIEQAARRHGYTDVVVLMDGTNRIVATPPTRNADVSQ